MGKLNSLYVLLLSYAGLWDFFVEQTSKKKKETREIVKKRMNTKERLLLFIVAIILCSIAVGIIKYFNGSSPLFDGITTVLSIFGMYLTVKRCIEQWIIWMIVNGLSSIMWLNLVLHGAKTYATFIMWCVYFILAIYFYIQWKKRNRCTRQKESGLINFVIASIYG